MPSAANVVYYLAHPVELRAMIQWKLWHQPVHERDASNQTETLKRCFYFLDKTSRSFAAVIKELHPEILMPMCIFYIILRGLDTIEDDMTIPLDVKDPILRGFDDILEKDGWSFTGNHAREKDRDLLVEFDCVIQEFAKIKPPYQKIIKDVTKRMGNGMADYCSNAEHNENGVDSIDDYIKYCHYVAGLVGEGCTRLFVEAGLANPALLDRPELMESMGQFLQQTNIIRDIKEDWDEHRRFWPKQIWSKYVDKFEHLMKPEHREAALNCNAEMINLALTRTDDSIFYLAGIKEQSVFNFCAIPQTMAIATLDVCFRNPEMFKRNVKITRGQACQVMMESTGNLRMVCEVFKRYAASIRRKNSPHDPNFLDVSITCGKMEKFIETIYPSQPKKTQESLEKQEKDRQTAKEERWEVFFVALSVLAAIVVCGVAMIFIAWMMGARFDIAFDELRKGHLIPPKSPDAAQRIAKSYDRSEL